MAQMVNRDCESFGKYRIIKSTTNRRHYTAILQNFGLHVFLNFWIPITHDFCYNSTFYHVFMFIEYWYVKYLAIQI